jgi:hypothetical protein
MSAPAQAGEDSVDRMRMIRSAEDVADALEAGEALLFKHSPT